MNKYSFLILFCIAFTGFRAQPGDVQKIQAVMEQQTTAWNQGNLEAFMDTYWKNDSLLFVGKKGVTYGWQQTLDHYRKAYPSRDEMGQLKFTLLKVQPLGPGFYNVVGKWQLSRKMGDLDGHFTLVFKKIAGNWKIIQDHSS
ncbi:nuclear transport factor 2 family protein [Niabella pedocola]|uniref:Nuclear transport factor 2 family protein n=1 Tax=Niabella pedocola TaxID=1752077 RepID=A0ABS8PUB9_9BACT|nr:nuclear transport factor 2 family protein [Niabella pedocola]MCD2423887.1 nuclear transport factor 2 family protein [Niabella pedocola]